MELQSFVTDYPVLPSVEELTTKHDRVRKYLDANELDGLLLTTSSNIAWYTGGSEVHISIANPNGACALLIMRDEMTILADATETPRMEREAFRAYQAAALIRVKLESRRWYEGLWKQVDRLAQGQKLGTDTAAASGLLFPASAKNVTYRIGGEDLLHLRYSLTRREIERYRVIGKRCAAAIENAAAKVRKGQSEFEVSAMMNKELYGLGLMPVISLIASDERIALYRHPLPTSKKVEKMCMLVTGARGGGLVCSATRLVHFGSLSPELRRKHDAVVQVEAALLANSHPGIKMSALFNTAKQAYADQGFPKEVEQHHQGGTTGYLPREYKAEPESGEFIYTDQAMAWNPSISGTKSEDTYLAVTDSRVLAGQESLECFTHGPGSWPLLKISVAGKTFYRPDILVI